ncbi:NAD(P)-dependent oxidoreductase [Rhodothermus bifroesti]|jgi:glutamate synthase (NADPH/NADH) small chain|uniref:NAD(P)-dependent oxidoreductase n=1 Tax=Rhodothermus marinus TaxID=29549 RepID=A0A7V2F751_RHOMR|nr:NAD(P)-dependent oxidoreductase [Rhodothermus bifroesti]GBD01540.1 Glutamate synthase [NADPH] small chain [bacterium HR18]
MEAIANFRTVFEEERPRLTDVAALLEASRCLECGRDGRPAPCIEACPTRIDIPGFIRAIREGDPLTSARIIFEANVLGGSCARVCPVEALCEGACVLTHEKRRPVAIGRLQRYATDAAFAAGIALHPPRRQAQLPLSVGVIGAGPAGLACAAELARLGHEVTVYEARSEPGGLVVSAIAPYKQMVEPIPQEVEAIRALGVTFCFNTSIGEDLSFAELESRHDALFLAVGLDGDMPLEIAGSDLEGVWPSLRFIERLKAMDPPPIGENVVVIGGGNTAIDVAREAVRLGARHVTVLYRRTEAEMPAFRHEVEAARDEGVQFEWLTLPVRLLGEVRVSGVECVRTRLVPDPSGGRPRPQVVEGTEFVLPADTVVFAIGQQPRTNLLATIPDLRIEQGRVWVDEHFQTSHPRLFAGGDCVNGGATVVEAVAQGKRAAHAIAQRIQPLESRPRPMTDRKETLQ